MNCYHKFFFDTQIVYSTNLSLPMSRMEDFLYENEDSWNGYELQRSAIVFMFLVDFEQVEFFFEQALSRNIRFTEIHIITNFVFKSSNVKRTRAIEEMGDCKRFKSL